MGGLGATCASQLYKGGVVLGETRMGKRRKEGEVLCSPKLQTPSFVNATSTLNIKSTI
jgi:hypothetical protein